MCSNPGFLEPPTTRLATHAAGLKVKSDTWLTRASYLWGRHTNPDGAAAARAPSPTLGDTREHPNSPGPTAYRNPDVARGVT